MEAWSQVVAEEREGGGTRGVRVVASTGLETG